MISQIFLLAFSVTGVYCSASKEHRSLRWASVFGLMAQPFWFYQTYTHEQWGIFSLSFVFTGLYMKGFYIYWLRVEPPKVCQNCTRGFVRAEGAYHPCLICEGSGFTL